MCHASGRQGAARLAARPGPVSSRRSCVPPADRIARLDTLDELCSTLGLCVPAVLGIQGATPAQLACWADAVDAVQRLLPVLHQLHAWQGQAQPGETGAPEGGAEPRFASLASTLVACILHQVPELLDSSAAPAALQGAGQRLWRAHSTCCRLVHWLCADGSRQVACGRPADACGWHRLLATLHLMALQAIDCLAPARDYGGLHGAGREVR